MFTSLMPENTDMYVKHAKKTAVYKHKTNES